MIRYSNILVIFAICLFISCTLRVEIPPIHVIADQPKGHDISEAYKSVAMVALQPLGQANTLGLGTAFAVNKKTLLTAGHVCVTIKKAQTAGIITRDIWFIYLGRADQLAKRKGAKIKNVDVVNDVCQLELKNHGLQPLRIADYNSVKFGDKVFIVGAPSGVMISITEGQVMNRLTSGLVSNMANGKLAISSPATGGHSGSPILNESGEVIGILSAGHTTYDHLSFGIPAFVVKRFMAFSRIKQYK